MKKAIVITGTSSGLGLALKEALAPRTDSAVIGLTKEEYDLSDRVAVGSLLRSLRSTLAGYTEVVFINNAAVVEPVGPVGSLADAALAGAIEINFTSAVRIINALCALPARIQIIHITTGAAREPLAGWSLYCSAKAAMEMFLQTLTKESPQVAVRLFNPGIMNTAMQAQIREHSAREFPEVEQFRAYSAEGKLEDPHRVAERLIAEYHL